MRDRGRNFNSVKYHVQVAASYFGPLRISDSRRSATPGACSHFVWAARTGTWTHPDGSEQRE